MNVQTTYTFKSIPNAKYAEVLADFGEVVAGQFEEVEGKYKRKPMAATLTMPEFYESLPDDLAKRVIQRTVEDFVKAYYVDQYAEVGAHDWAFIASEMAKQRGRTTFAIDDALWSVAAETVAAWIAATNGNPKLAAPFKAIIAGKFTENTIRKNLGKSDADTLKKVEGYINSWASWVAEHDTDNSDDCAIVYDAITKKLDKMLKREEGEVIADIL